MRSAPLFPLTPILNLIHSMPIVTRRDRRRAVLLLAYGSVAVDLAC